MAPRRTRISKKGVITNEKEDDTSTNATKVSNKPEAGDAQVLQETVNDNLAAKQELEELKVKYAAKKRTIKELKHTIKNQEEKILLQDNYIIKLKKDRKKAEQIHKNSIANLVTTSAQNQALMAVLTTHQQSVQQMLPAQHIQSIPFHPNHGPHQSALSNNLMLFGSHQPLYLPSVYHSSLPRQYQ